MIPNELTYAIIETAIRIHRELGPGLLESVYRKILVYELKKKGFNVCTELPIPVIWQNVRLDLGFRADVIVEELVVVETKSVELIHPVHKKQLLTHLRLAGKPLGLLINFNVDLLKNGISRIVNNLTDQS